MQKKEKPVGFSFFVLVSHLGFGPTTLKRVVPYQLGY